MVNIKKMGGFYDVEISKWLVYNWFIIKNSLMRKNMAYYYNQLSKIEQKAYYAMKEGLLNMAPSFTVPLLDGKTLSDIYFMVRMDHPEIFWSVKFSYKYYKDSDHAEMIPEYLFKKNQIMEHRTAMESRVKKLARQAEKLSEKEKELFIHDFICQNVRYDKLKKAYSHEIIGPLGQGVGVCEGIAKSVKILCDALGIWCVIPISGNNPEKGIKYRHCWKRKYLRPPYCRHPRTALLPTVCPLRQCHRWKIGAPDRKVRPGHRGEGLPGIAGRPQGGHGHCGYLRLFPLRDHLRIPSGR